MERNSVCEMRLPHTPFCTGAVSKLLPVGPPTYHSMMTNFMAWWSSYLRLHYINQGLYPVLPCSWTGTSMSISLSDGDHSYSRDYSVLFIYDKKLLTGHPFATLYSSKFVVPWRTSYLVMLPFSSPPLPCNDAATRMPTSRPSNQAPWRNPKYCAELASPANQRLSTLARRF